MVSRHLHGKTITLVGLDQYVHQREIINKIRCSPLQGVAIMLLLGNTSLSVTSITTEIGTQS